MEAKLMTEAWRDEALSKPLVANASNVYKKRRAYIASKPGLLTLDTDSRRIFKMGLQEVSDKDVGIVVRETELGGCRGPLPAAEPQAHPRTYSSWSETTNGQDSFSNGCKNQSFFLSGANPSVLLVSVGRFYFL